MRLRDDEERCSYLTSGIRVDVDAAVHARARKPAADRGLDARVGFSTAQLASGIGPADCVSASARRTPGEAPRTHDGRNQSRPTFWSGPFRGRILGATPYEICDENVR